LTNAATAALSWADFASGNSVEKLHANAMNTLVALGIIRRATPPASPARREEGLKDGGALLDEDAGRDLHLVIEEGIAEDLEAGADCTALGVVRAVNQSRNAGLYDGSGAHAAGLNGDVKSCAGHAIVAEKVRRFTDYQDFGVSSGIAVADRAIARAGQDFVAEDDERANGDFPGSGCGAGFFEGDLHE